MLLPQVGLTSPTRVGHLAVQPYRYSLTVLPVLAAS